MSQADSSLGLWLVSNRLVGLTSVGCLLCDRGWPQIARRKLGPLADQYTLARTCRMWHRLGTASIPGLRGIYEKEGYDLAKIEVFRT